jgi:hypothetical protein
LQYLTVWICGTCCLIALALLVWNGLQPLLPPDVNRLRLLLIAFVESSDGVDVEIHAQVSLAGEASQISRI